MDLGLAIRKARTHLGYSQEQLSKSTGLSQTTISQIENGLKQPSRKTTDKICKALGVSEDLLYVLGLIPEESPLSGKSPLRDLYPKIEAMAYELLDKTKNAR